MSILKHIARILVGCLFIFSGFVKGIDPQGFAIKLSEYFVSFGLPEWEGLALILAVAVITGELLIGICLFIGLQMRITAWAALLFMSFFTLLTLYIALFNPVSDCGCFGDAIILSNWATFYKNIILILITIFIFFNRNWYSPLFKPVIEWCLIIIYAGCGIGVFSYCIRHLPIIDFRPYHIGANIPEGMTKPEGTPNDKFKTLFVYKKNGVLKEFTSDNYPWNDSTWTWVESKQILLQKGYTPPIHDFSIIKENGEDITDSILQNKNYTFLLIAEDLGKASREGLLKATSLGNQALKQGYGFYCMTASPLNEADIVRKMFRWSFPVYSTDRTTLKTIIRSNPGLLLIKEGTVIGQWHYNDFPATDIFSKDLMAMQFDRLRKEGDSRMILSFIFLFLISAIGVWSLQQKFNK